MVNTATFIYIPPFSFLTSYAEIPGAIPVYSVKKGRRFSGGRLLQKELDLRFIRIFISKADKKSSLETRCIAAGGVKPYNTDFVKTLWHFHPAKGGA